MATDTLALGVSSGAATALQGVTTFGLSKLLNTADFGAWREFVLCATYTGILHAGLADGLQVAWCADVPGRHSPTLRSGILALLSIQGCWLVVGVLLSIVARPIEPFPFFFLAVALFALAWNTSTVSQFHAQCRERFGRLSTFVMLYPAVVLLGAAALLGVHAATPLHLALLASVAVGIASVLAFRGADDSLRDPASAGAPLTYAETLGLGLPILALNSAMIGIATFDKVAASILFPPKVFAIYAFASVLVVFMGSAITAGSRVLLPAFARRASEGTLENAARASTTAIVLVWSAGLVGYFPAAAVVGRFLPKYALSLPLSRPLFIAAVFLAIPQIVHMNACRALRIERTYLKWTAYLLFGAFAAALLIGRSFGMGALAPLALLAALAWTGGGTVLLARRGIRAYHGVEIPAAVWCALGFAAAASYFGTWTGCCVYLLVAAPLWTILALRVRRPAA